MDHRLFLLSFTAALIGLLAACSGAVDSNQSTNSKILPPEVTIVSDSTTPVILPTGPPTEPQEVEITNTVSETFQMESLSEIYGNRLIEWIEIPKINVRAPVVPVGWVAGTQDENLESTWDSPSAAVGWVITSALPGDREGNIILYGHNNIESSIFMYLFELDSGDTITLQTGNNKWDYHISERLIIPVGGNENEETPYLAYIKPTLAPRLTVISCWPPTGNSHRVIIIAYPVL